MNCNDFKEKMYDYLLSDNLPQDFEKHLADCSDCSAEFEQLKQTVQTLKPKIKVCASNNFSHILLNKLKKEDQKMKKRIPFYMKVAVFLVLIATSLFLVFFNTNSNYQVTARPVNQILTESIMKMLAAKSIRIEMEIRTLKDDNFELIGTEYDFVKHLIKVEFSPQKWIIEKPGRTVLFDGTFKYLNIKKLDYVIKGGPYAGFVEWLSIFFTPDKILEIEKERAENEGSEYKVEESANQIVLTIYQKAQGDFTNDYLKDSSVEESDNKRIFYFDKKNYQLLAFELFVIENQKEILVMKTTKIKYDETFKAKDFTVKIFGNKAIESVETLVPAIDKDLKDKTPEEIARIFLEALGNKDWKTVEKIYPRCGKLFKRQFEELEIIEIGTSFKSGTYSGVFVPYSIKLKSGGIKSWNLALRNDNSQGMWMFDGGM